jgi:hypothetical protein
MKAQEIPIAANGYLLNASPHFLSWLLQPGGGSGAIPVELTTPDRLAALRDHGITPWLYRRVMEDGWQMALDPAVTTSLRHDYLASLAVTIVQEEETRQILTALTSSGLIPILLKGADLRIRVYEDAATRPMGDLDLLLSRDDVPQAYAVFLKLGYRPYGHGESKSGLRQQYGYELEFAPPDAKVLPVDLHWEIRGAACVHHLAYEPLRAQVVSWRYQEIPVHLLSPEHALLHLCLHAFTLGEISLRAALDLALVITCLPLKWDRFRYQVNQFRFALPVGAVLERMATLWPDLVPADLLAELAHYRPSVEEKLVLGLRHQLRRLGFRFPYLFRHRHLWEGATFILNRLRKKS